MIETQRQQSDGDDEGLDYDRPSPIADQVLVHPAKADEWPRKKWPRNETERTEVDDGAKVFVCTHNGGNGDGLEDFERLGPDKEAFTGLAGVANSDSEGVRSFDFGTGGAGRSVNGIAKGDDTNVFGLVRNKSGCEILTAYAGPVVSAGESGSACNFFRREMIVVAIGLKLELAGSVGRDIGLFSPADGP